MAFIIVGLDNSEASHLAFHEAIRQAEWRNADLLAIHTVALPVTTGYEYVNVLDDLLRMGRESTEKQLEELAATYPDGFPVTVRHRVETGHAGVRILEAAKGEGDNEPAQLVVLGSRGLGGFKGLLLGSVTTYASHHLTCPLLIVPAPVGD